MFGPNFSDPKLFMLIGQVAPCATMKPLLI